VNISNDKVELYEKNVSVKLLVIVIYHSFQALSKYNMFNARQMFIYSNTFWTFYLKFKSQPLKGAFVRYGGLKKDSKEW